MPNHVWKWFCAGRVLHRPPFGTEAPCVDTRRRLLGYIINVKCFFFCETAECLCYHESRNPSVAMLAQAISCSNVRDVFPFTELLFFCLVQMSAMQFCSLPPVLMASIDGGCVYLSFAWYLLVPAQSIKSSEMCCYHSLVDSQISVTESRPSVKPWV